MGAFVRRFQKGIHVASLDGERRETLIKRDHKVWEIVTIKKFAAQIGIISRRYSFRLAFATRILLRDRYDNRGGGGVTLIANGGPRIRTSKRDQIRLLHVSRSKSHPRESHICEASGRICVGQDCSISCACYRHNFHGWNTPDTAGKGRIMVTHSICVTLRAIRPSISLHRWCSKGTPPYRVYITGRETNNKRARARARV